MTNYREILRLYSLGLNKTEIASSCRCARNTVAATLQREANCGLQWPLSEEMSDKQLSERLFPTSPSKPAYKMPDYCEEFSMILTDYFLSTPDLQWRLAKQAGVRHAVVRLPEDEAFDMTDPAHIRAVAERFKAEGLRPLVVEPMPNSVHDHIKRADALRDASIEKVLQMILLLAENGFTTICTNFAAEVGWYRTRSDYPERGGALATAFCLEDAKIDPSLTVSEQGSGTGFRIFWTPWFHRRSAAASALRCTRTTRPCKSSAGAAGF